jgi:hypothetical protein
MMMWLATSFGPGVATYLQTTTWPAGTAEADEASRSGTAIIAIAKATKSRTILVKLGMLPPNVSGGFGP